MIISNHSELILTILIRAMSLDVILITQSRIETPLNTHAHTCSRTVF